MPRHDATPTAQDRADARALLAKLRGSDRRNRSAFMYGYTLAFNDMAHDLDDTTRTGHLARTRALHDICHEEYL